MKALLECLAGKHDVIEKAFVNAINRNRDTEDIELTGDYPIATSTSKANVQELLLWMERVQSWDFMSVSKLPAVYGFEGMDTRELKAFAPSFFEGIAAYQREREAKN